MTIDHFGGESSGKQHNITTPRSYRNARHDYSGMTGSKNTWEVAL